MKKIESYLPIFPGFYNTLFECDCEESEIEEGKTYDDYDFDYADYHKRVAERCVEAIENELKDFNIKVEFQDLISPRFYNFSNDSINVEYTLENNSFDLVLDYLNENKEEFKTYIKERYTSYDGFSSFYSNDADVWLNEYLKDDKKQAHAFGAVLDFILFNEEYTSENLYGDVCDEMYVYGELKENVK